jgi:hypothetical protein
MITMHVMSLPLNWTTDDAPEFLTKYMRSLSGDLRERYEFIIENGTVRYIQDELDRDRVIVVADLSPIAHTKYKLMWGRG